MEMRLDRKQSKDAMQDWIAIYPKLPSIDKKFEQMRLDLQRINAIVRDELISNKSIKSTEYYIDINIGLRLYEYFQSKPYFSLRTASDDGFWRFLSLVVVPDLVAQRWGRDNESHYWSQPTRIWLRSLWWYVHLSWQGDLESTRSVLESAHFTTDTILNLEERSGRKGTYVNSYRAIMKYYSLVPSSILKKNSRSKKGNNDDLFRKVMKLNTAKLMVMDPSLYLGGEDGYAKSLFEEVGVDWSAT